MSKQRVVVATFSLAAIACGSGGLLSPRTNWAADFADRSPPTNECQGGSLTQLRTKMAVSEPHDLARFGQNIPKSVGSQITASDNLHTFRFSTDPAVGSFWGFSGYLVARGDCIVYAQVTSHDN